VPVVSVFATNKWISKLCVAPESAVQKVADLKGKRVGVPSATSGQKFFAQAMVKRVGVPPEAVEYLPTGFGAAAAEAMKQGKVDALAYWGGWYIQVENMGYKFRCYELPGMERAPGHALFTLEDTVKNKPDLVERVGRAHAKGLVYAMSHPEATARAYWTVYPEAKPHNVPEAQALASNARLVARILQDFQWDYPGWRFGMHSPEGWSGLVQYLVETGQLAQGVAAERLYSNALVDKYNAFDAAKVRSLP
jgi:NitT/TauT family transport system substrate-binding protein